MKRTIGIMGAMPEEIEGVAKLLTGRQELTTGNRTYYSGYLNGIHTVVVFSRWGKVAAAATAATLIHKFHITDLLFTGVAGAIQPEMNTGDIVIGTKLIQHDLDARPLIQQFEIPLLGITYIQADAGWVKKAENAVQILLDSRNLHAVLDDKDLQAFGLTHPKWYSGAIASGDAFFYKPDQRHDLLSGLPGILCVEMEGAAVAQVCYESNIPFAVIRTISDGADEQSPLDFARFTKKVASIYSAEIVKSIYSQL